MRVSKPMKLERVMTFLKDFAPLELAEDWDNVGLLLGDAAWETDSIMTCLTLTPDVAREAISQNVSLIVTHHPILFRPVKKLTAETEEGRMLLELASRRIAVYSPHTAFDSAQQGINSQWCALLGLQDVEPIRPDKSTPATGAGRLGLLPEALSLQQFLQQVKSVLGLEKLEYVSAGTHEIRKVGVACGSAAEFLSEAKLQGCDVLVLGEARFHACLEARSLGIALVLVGHYASERFACENLAELLQLQFSDLKVFASQAEQDPLSWC